MQNKVLQREQILWKKVKLYWAISWFLVIDLAFLLGWGIVLLGFNKAIQWMDPIGSFWLLKFIAYVSEFSIGGLLIYSIIKDSKSVIDRITHEHQENLRTEQKVDEGDLYKLEESGKLQKASDGISVKRLS